MVNSTHLRNSRIELLRIAAMIFIIFSHISVHGGFPNNYSDLTINTFLVDWAALGNVGVGIFVLITGYFLSSKNNTVKSAPKLWSQVWTYSVLLLIVQLMFNSNVGIKDILKSLFPTIFKNYWFFTVYIILLIFTPFINRLIKSLTKSQLSYLIIIATIIWSIIPTFTNQSLMGNNLIYFLNFYLIGAYFKLYDDNIFSKKKVRISLTTFAILLLLLSSVIIKALKLKANFEIIYPTYFYSLRSCLVLLICVGIFSLAIYSKPFYNKFINALGGCMFGVYLIHENIFVSPILWNKITPIYKLYDSPYLIFGMIGSVAFILITCSLIEYIRQKTISKPLSNFVNIIIKKVNLLLSKLYNSKSGKTSK